MGPKLKVFYAVGASVVATLAILAIVSLLPGFYIPPRFYIVGMLCCASIATPVCVLLVRQAEENKRLRKALEQRVTELARLADMDGLTGLLSRRAFLGRAHQAHGSAGNWFLLVDIDHFKRFNDEHGHQTGDAVLNAVATAITTALHPTDFCGRLGGEEFVACLVGYSPEEARQRAERVRKAIQAMVIAASNGKMVRVTASIGLCADNPDDPIDVSLHRADLAMYAAKTSGRNQVKQAA